MLYNLVNFCECDKYAIKSYCAIHNETEDKNLGDITKVKVLPKCNFLTYGFPCQDVSTIGLQAGIIKNKTRSGLLFEVERLLENADYKPKFLIMENVKNLVGIKYKADFDRWLLKLEKLGYVNYWKVLNSKDYGIPQNRERVFCVSIRNDINHGFKFPSQTKLEVKLSQIIGDGNVIYDDRDKGWGIKEHSVYCPCQRANRAGLKVKSEKGLIRYLTPLESMQLTGFTENDYINICNITPKTYIFKQTGNSIVVNVLSHIYRQLAKLYPNDFIEMIDIITLFSGIGAFEKAFDNVSK